jgi:Immunity protein Imm1
MMVSDIGGEHEVTSLEELEKTLTRRFEDEQANEFWMSHDPEWYPGLMLSVKGDLACIHYFPAERDPAFQSIGNVRGLAPGRTTTFASRVETFDMPNSAILHLADALPVVREFFYSGALPKSIKWLEL